MKTAKEWADFFKQPNWAGSTEGFVRLIQADAAADMRERAAKVASTTQSWGPGDLTESIGDLIRALPLEEP